MMSSSCGGDCPVSCFTCPAAPVVVFLPPFARQWRLKCPIAFSSLGQMLLSQRNSWHWLWYVRKNKWGYLMEFAHSCACCFGDHFQLGFYDDESYWQLPTIQEMRIYWWLHCSVLFNTLWVICQSNPRQVVSPYPPSMLNQVGSWSVDSSIQKGPSCIAIHITWMCTELPWCGWRTWSAHYTPPPAHNSGSTPRQIARQSALPVTVITVSHFDGMFLLDWVPVVFPYK